MLQILEITEWPAPWNLSKDSNDDKHDEDSNRVYWNMSILYDISVILQGSVYYAY